MSLSKNTPSDYAPNGFTLIELSIVLVILGLLSAGILVGRDLIRASEVRAQVSQIEKLNTAANTFRVKFGCVPGDCKKATTLGLGGLDGNGNDAIESTIFVQFNSDEATNFWVHLGNSQLINFTAPAVAGTAPGINSPPLAMKASGIGGNYSAGGMWIAFYDFVHGNFVGTSYRFPSAANAWYLTTSMPSTGVDGVYLPIDAYVIDSKVDDGKPLSGNVAGKGSSIYSMGGISGQRCDAGSCVGTGVLTGGGNEVGPTGCAEDSTGEVLYNVRYTTPAAASLCAIGIKMQW